MLTQKKTSMSLQTVDIDVAGQEDTYTMKREPEACELRFTNTS
jgi:hypothetical protein